MFRDGWVKPSAFKCECCKGKEYTPEEVFKHVTDFELTEKGRDLLPERIMP